VSDCCEQKSCDLERLGATQSRVLWIVLGINLTMFFVEVVSGYFARSLALSSDSLDMLGDAITYGTSIYVIKRGIQAKARVAVLKAWIIVLSAMAILGAAVHRLYNPTVPDFSAMGGVGLLALAANVVCLLLLTRHRNDDINMNSVWICSRNDIIANTSVLGAAVLVYYFNSPWPDLIVATALSVLFLRSARHIFAKARS
jgi:cation diffusion facilitator family transporter